MAVADRVATSLAADRAAATYPDVDTPFADAVDVVQRLLPYHVFQHPQEDLDAPPGPKTAAASRKGKRKATDEDLLREEIAGAFSHAYIQLRPVLMATPGDPQRPSLRWNAGDAGGRCKNASGARGSGQARWVPPGLSHQGADSNLLVLLCVALVSGRPDVSARAGGPGHGTNRNCER